MSRPSRELVVYTDPEDTSKLWFNLNKHLTDKRVTLTPSAEALLSNKSEESLLKTGGAAGAGGAAAAAAEGPAAMHPPN